MRKIFAIAILVAVVGQAGAQDDTSEVKTGWNFGLLPAVSFDSDLGYQYGGLINLYQYGDGSRYPKYDHSLYFEVSRYTKGSGIYRFYYDSDRLLDNVRITADVSYLPDQAYDFFGFNGYESVYRKEWIDESSPEYRTRMFYKMQQKLFRFKTDFQGPLSGESLRWIAGMNLLNFSISSVDIDRLNKGKSDEDKLPPVKDMPGLYERYQEWGLISEEEADGGFVPELKAGVVYDTRDNRPNPMKGMWTEAVIIAAPEFLGAESGFMKFSLMHRQYFTLIPEDLSFAYRIGWQQTLAGEVPFYYQSQIVTSVMTGASSTGLGGARSLRGMMRNRVVGDGFVFSNFEMRWKPLYFRAIKQNFYLGLNGFMDAGMAVGLINIKDKLDPATASNSDYFDFGAEELHISYGAGLRLAMNKNFIIAVDYGISADKRDGDSGLYIGLNYLF